MEFVETLPRFRRFDIVLVVVYRLTKLLTSRP